jgi:tetratricopeptide repeat protein
MPHSALLAEMFSAGAAAVEREDLQAAERIFRSILEEDPQAHPAWNALAIVALRSGAAGSAMEYAMRATELDRRNPLYLSNLGIAYGEAGKLADAERALSRALKLKPVYPEALFNLGKVLHKRGLLAESLRAYERAYAMGARFPELCVTLAQRYLKNGWPERGLGVLPHEGAQEAEVTPVMSECLLELHGPERAELFLRQSIARHPESAALRLTLSYLLLSTGRWREGWRYYAARYGARGDDAAPLGPGLDGRPVRLEGEQGLGDVLFFLRFMPELAARGGGVTLRCASKLAALLQGDQRFACVLDNSVDVESSSGERILVGDLPARLGGEDCPAALRLTADPARRQQCLDRLAQLGPPPYLGLTWRAGTDVLHRAHYGSEDHKLLSKDVPTGELGQALRGWAGTLLSLQRDPGPAELDAVAAAAGAKVHDVSALNDDLLEMLALLDVLREYVAVSNTNIHLLAGLGRSARVLIPYPPEWRWMRREGRSAWFPDFPVYREPSSRGWTEPFARLRAELFA